MFVGLMEAEEERYWKSLQHRQTCWDKIHDQFINMYTELYAPSFMCKLCPTVEDVQPEAIIYAWTVAAMSFVCRAPCYTPPKLHSISLSKYLEGKAKTH